MDWGTLAALAGLLTLQTWWFTHSLNALGDSLNKRIDDLRADLIARVEELREDMNARLGELREDVRGLDDRLRGLERERS